MFKGIGIFALILSATGAALLPKAAFAQDGYYAPRDSYYDTDRDGTLWICSLRNLSIWWVISSHLCAWRQSSQDLIARRSGRNRV